MAIFSFTINAPTTPIAEADFYTTLPNTSLMLPVLENDFLGTEPTVLTIEIAPANGTAMIVGDQINYTPNTDYVGTDSFYYRITDSNPAYHIAKVNITIE